jgi:probable phosphoglycerate mutase
MPLYFRRKFYFIRHGETAYNQEKRYTGLHDIPLNTNGKQQIKSILHSLEDKDISCIYTSPLKRALESACIVATHLNIPIIVLDKLKERDFGIFQGRKKLHYKKRYFYQGQTLYRHTKDTLIAFHQIKQQSNFLIVAHSGTYKALSKYLLGQTISQSIANAQPICFEQDKNKKWQTKLLNI